MIVRERAIQEFSMKTQRTVLIVLLAAALFQIAYYYPQLPATVASHFGAGGQANGWASKEFFFGLYLGILALMVLSFAGIPVVFRRIPPGLINLPNKDYWLAPERVGSTVQALGREMLVFGNATIAFMVAVFELAIQANLSESGRLPQSLMWILLAVYMLFTAIWLVQFYRRFARPPLESSG